jgi:hypothetical protein
VPSDGDDDVNIDRKQFILPLCALIQYFHLKMTHVG